MISKQELQEACRTQKSRLVTGNSYPRNALSGLPINLHDFALVISGIRRCGKSTLMGQMMAEAEKDGNSVFYLNFDTPNAYGFTFDDFRIVDEMLAEMPYDILFFDEIQVVDGWEMYIRGKLDEGYKVVVTGSNASMLSRELGTKLTGRHITRELFPFSYNEFCGYKSLPFDEKSLAQYLCTGGFPKYVETGEDELLEELVKDILYRDIVVRYNLRDERTLKLTLSLLLSNVGNLVTASKMKQQLGVKSVSTITDYFSFFEQTYLLAFVPKFAYSMKAQLVNPKKIYCIDNGIVSAVFKSFSRNDGHKLENMVYCYLRRKYKEIYYFNEGMGECDFIVADGGIPQIAIQVCWKLTAENRDREVNGLITAMSSLNIEQGYLLTFNQNDTIMEQGKPIQVKPAFEWCAD